MTQDEIAVMDGGKCILQLRGAVSYTHLDVYKRQDMLTEDDEKEDIVVFVPKGRNAESYKDIAKEEIDSLTQNAEELRVVYKE